ncbi:MAG TPA: M56 family metallopeptidase [Frateuria sp.]|uniref:M56 family metallopeptidase n=1 Tax=Frateuria sp. TaxID=2211372 RepID=UPI002D7F1640|nr:M56 family metallopeptidase [Frateuria sp.]HET6805715.1 M56 family metallopeptidase [Frateuria sp.]
MPSPATLLDALSVRLLWTSAQACLLIGAVALACRLLPRLPAAVRCMLWWLVGAQLLLGLAWHAPLQLRWLPPPEAMPAEAIHALPRVVSTRVTPTVPGPATPAVDLPVEAATLPWPRYLLAVWLAGITLQLALVARQGWRAARARRHARLAPVAWQAACRRQAGQLGLRRAPPIALSPAVGSPQVLGAWRPLVLFPADARLSDEETAMAIAHELAHLRRGDLWLGWIPALAQRLFFFHPLVAWAMREYALSREAACDAQALACTGSAPQAYGRLLLRLGVAAPLRSGLAGASPTFHNLKRRLTMLQHIEATSRRSRGWLLLVAIAVAGVLPYRVTAGSAQAPADGAQAVPAAAPAARPAPAAAPAPAAPAAQPAPAAHHRLPPPPPPAPPGPPPPPPAPPAPPPPPPALTGFSGHHVHIDTDSDARSGLAIFDGDTAIISGNDADISAASRLQHGNGPLVWFRHEGKAYVVRDPTVVARARAIYAPVTRMAGEQGRLAGEQGRLAGQQAGLAARDAAFAREQAALAGAQAELAAEAAEGAGDRAAAREHAARRHAIEQQQARLEQRHARAQKEIAAQQQELETQQATFAKQQRELAQRQQEISRQAEQQMQQLLEEAIRTGKAQAVRVG